MRDVRISVLPVRACLSRSLLGQASTVPEVTSGPHLEMSGALGDTFEALNLEKCTHNYGENISLKMEMYRKCLYARRTQMFST